MGWTTIYPAWYNPATTADFATDIKGARMKRKVKSFKATGSTSGRVYSIDMWVDRIATPGFDTPNASVDGMAELRTSDGQHVNRISKGKYQVLGGENMTSDDPNAP
jgi:hypothetical protein